MALCLDFYNATANGFYLNNVEGVITELWENAVACFCNFQLQGQLYTLTFGKEISILIDGHSVKMWLGNGSQVHRNIAHICFDADKQHVRILTRAVYNRIQSGKLQKA